MGDFAGRDGVLKGSDDTTLPDDLIEGLRAIFVIKSFVGHRLGLLYLSRASLNRSNL